MRSHKNRLPISLNRLLRQTKYTSEKCSPGAVQNFASWGMAEASSVTTIQGNFAPLVLQQVGLFTAQTWTTPGGRCPIHWATGTWEADSKL